MEEGRGRLQTGKAKELQGLDSRLHGPAPYGLVRGAEGSSENSYRGLWPEMSKPASCTPTAPISKLTSFAGQWHPGTGCHMLGLPSKSPRDR